MLITCNLALCLRIQQLILSISLEGCKKSIMLMKNSLRYFLWTYRKLLTKYEGKCWNEEERNARSFGKVSDESV